MLMKVLVVLAVLTVVGAAAPLAAPAQKLTLTMTDFALTPKAVAVKAGAAVELTLINKGAVQHEFMLYTPLGNMGMTMDMDAWGAESTYFKGIGTVEVVSDGRTSRTSGMERVMVDPGKSVTVRFVAKRTGTFEFGCHITGHYEAGMKGALTVK